MVALLISRKLAHKLNNKLQIIIAKVEERNAESIKTACHEMSELINSCVESKADEQARSQREEHED